MAGRKPRITDKQLEEIVGRIAHEKASVSTACDGICAPSAFYARLNASQPLQEQYARARESRADARFESLDAVLGAMRQGQIDPATARVMVDTIKWQCAHEKPSRYGESSLLAGALAAGSSVKVTIETVGAPAVGSPTDIRRGARMMLLHAV
jgi:hypothetical protein